MPNTRTLDPSTSHQAEKSVTGLAETYRIMLGAFKSFGPMNDETLIRIWRNRPDWKQVSDSGIRSRRSELTASGLIEDSGHREKMASGRMSIVWRIA